LDDKTVIGYFEKHPTYLVYFHKGKLAKVLNFSLRCQYEHIIIIYLNASIQQKIITYINCREHEQDGNPYMSWF